MTNLNGSYGDCVGGDVGAGGLTVGIFPLPTSGAGLESAGTGPVGVVGPSGVMVEVGIFLTVVVVVVVVVLCDAPVLEL